MLPNPTWAALNSSSLTVACVTAIALVTGSACFAQVAGGTISGSVRDSSGRAIAGALIAVKNSETAILRSINADNDGIYTAPNLVAGTYQISASKEGFATLVRSGVLVTEHFVLQGVHGRRRLIDRARESERPGQDRREPILVLDASLGVFVLDHEEGLLRLDLEQLARRQLVVQPVHAFDSAGTRADRAAPCPAARARRTRSASSRRSACSAGSALGRSPSPSPRCIVWPP